MKAECTISLLSYNLWRVNEQDTMFILDGKAEQKPTKNTSKLVIGTTVH